MRKKYLVFRRVKSVEQERQLDISFRHEFLLDQHLNSSDLDHKQVDRRKDPLINKKTNVEFIFSIQTDRHLRI